MARRSNSDAEFVWEQQENESAEAYEAFSLYRDGWANEKGVIERHHSLAEVGQRLGKSKTLMDRWSSRHDLVYRLREYDKHIERAALEKATKNLETMRKKQIVLASGLQDKAYEALSKLSAEVLAQNPRILLAFIKEGSSIEARARISEQEAHRPTTHETAEDEALQKLDDILGRIKSGF